MLRKSLFTPPAPPWREVFVSVARQQVAAAFVRFATRPYTSVVAACRLPRHCAAQRILLAQANTFSRCRRGDTGSVGGAVGASVGAFVGAVVGAFIGCIVGTFVGLHHWCISRVSLVVPATRLRDMCIEL